MPNSEFSNSSDSSLFKSGESLLQNNRWTIVSSLVGLVLVGGGIFIFGSKFLEQPKVEIIKDADTVEKTQSEEIVVVEISGYVESPGVYKFAKESRIEDLLIAAGGLNKSADRNYVEKNINRAGKLSDGQKVYIPKEGEVTSSTVLSQGTVKGVSTTSSIDTAGDKLNVNSASLKDLDSLTGIGATRAQAIIDHRPYSTIDDLVSKKVLPKSVFDKIKDQIMAQ
jgi:competence protein ComEA